MTGPETWNVSDGKITHQGKTAVVEDSFADSRSPKGSGTNTPVRSRLQTPVGSRAGTPVPSAAEDGSSKPAVKQKKKMTRNQLKAQEERRRIRKINWLQFGGPKPEDTDDDDGP
jgi:elongation factor 3